jgi:hypothetical protein
MNTTLVNLTTESASLLRRYRKQLIQIQLNPDLSESKKLECSTQLTADTRAEREVLEAKIVAAREQRERPTKAQPTTNTAVPTEAELGAAWDRAERALADRDDIMAAVSEVVTEAVKRGDQTTTTAVKQWLPSYIQRTHRGMGQAAMDAITSGVLAQVDSLTRSGSTPANAGTGKDVARLHLLANGLRAGFDDPHQEVVLPRFDAEATLTVPGAHELAAERDA